MGEGGQLVWWGLPGLAGATFSEPGQFFVQIAYIVKVTHGAGGGLGCHALVTSSSDGWPAGAMFQCARSPPTLSNDRQNHLAIDTLMHSARERAMSTVRMGFLLCSVELDTRLFGI